MNNKLTYYIDGKETSIPLLEEALQKYYVYVHNNETGKDMICNVHEGKFCSICGAGNSIAWIIRNKNKVVNPFETAQLIYNNWNKERWYNANKERLYLAIMLFFLKNDGEIKK